MSTFDSALNVHVTKNWEFSKKLTFAFVVMFAFHLVVFLISALFNVGQTEMIKDSLTSLSPFYLAVITGYLGKSAFENFDINRNKITMRKLANEYPCNDDGSSG